MQKNSVLEAAEAAAREPAHKNNNNKSKSGCSDDQNRSSSPLLLPFTSKQPEEAFQFNSSFKLDENKTSVSAASSIGGCVVVSVAGARGLSNNKTNTTPLQQTGSESSALKCAQDWAGKDTSGTSVVEKEKVSKGKDILSSDHWSADLCVDIQQRLSQVGERLQCMKQRSQRAIEHIHVSSNWDTGDMYTGRGRGLQTY